MSKYFFTLLFFPFLICLSQQEGPIISQKLENPEIINRQHIQKRSKIWIEPQWKFDNGNYIWVSGHWAQKRVGYQFINGYWIKKEDGWSWVDGYWEKISIKKWRNLYS